jgi:hypothetical protein
MTEARIMGLTWAPGCSFQRQHYGDDGGHDRHADEDRGFDQQERERLAGVVTLRRSLAVGRVIGFQRAIS